MTARKTFTYNGLKSSDFGLWLIGCTVYNSPSRNLETIKIPGRDGVSLLDNRVFDEITISYDVAIAPTSERTLAESVDLAKLMLYQTNAEVYDYVKLSDDYRPDVYRYAVFTGPIDWETQLNRFGRTTLNFLCKPQQYTAAGTLTMSDIGAGSYGRKSLGSLIPTTRITTSDGETRYFFDHVLSIREIRLKPDGSELTGHFNITTQDSEETDYSDIDVEIGSDPVYIGYGTTIKIDTNARTITTDTRLTLNKYIYSSAGSWFTKLPQKTTASPTLWLYNNTGQTITAEYDYEVYRI